MNCEEQFKEFNKTIKLADSKRSKLSSNRKALREKIRDYLKEKECGTPKFSSQGSFTLNTIVNPIKEKSEDGTIKEKYDVDDGVYFISDQSEKKTKDTYHTWIKSAVEGHTEEIIDKSTCVRVIYSDGHHIDLPIYWMENEESIPQLAHKSKDFFYSDPREFKEWVGNKIGSSNEDAQLRKIIRYLKAWKDYRESQNLSLKLPSGFILTILCCNNYHNDSRDDLALTKTVENIYNKLSREFNCYRPTTPSNEELLVKYSEEKTLNELEKFVTLTRKAIESNNEKEASEHWRTLFGVRFPLAEGNNSKNSQSSIRRTPVSKPWRSN